MKVVYVSYDGLLDPLGSSQIAPYLRALARRGHRFTLVTFEKPERAAVANAVSDLRRGLETDGVRWRPLVYHRSPRLLSTALDLRNGMRAIRAELRRTEVALVHCRGDVAMAMARGAAAAHRVPLLYDMRGFFADERCESGSWRRGSLLDRIVRRQESLNLRAAAALVVLTHAALRMLLARGQRLPPNRVIPTSVDLDRFRPSSGRRPDFGLAYVGSLGTWYLNEQMVRLARTSVVAGLGRPLFLTNQPNEARAAGASPDWAEVSSVPHADVPGWLRRCRALFFLIRPTPAKAASCPTKVGEALACGLPVLANAAIGDLDDLLESERVGVVVPGLTEAAYGAGLSRLRSMVDDQATAVRCRGVAERLFDVEIASDRYAELYAEATAPRAAATTQETTL